MKVELVTDKKKKPKNKKPNCLECGVCCYMPSMVGKTYKGITIDENGWCVYYDKDKKCTIYSNRPDFCRPVEGKKNLEAGDETCLFIRSLYPDKIKKENQ